MAFQPVVALAAIENDLEAGNPNRNQDDPYVVDPQTATATSLDAFRGEFNRIVDQPARKDQRDQADRNVDKENPAPRETICNPSSKRRTDRRRSDYRHAVERESAAELFLGKGIDQDGLLDG